MVHKATDTELSGWYFWVGCGRGLVKGGGDQITNQGRQGPANEILGAITREKEAWKREQDWHQKKSTKKCVMPIAPMNHITSSHWNRLASRSALLFERVQPNLYNCHKHEHFRKLPLHSVLGLLLAVFGSTTGSVWVYYCSVWVYYWQCLGLLLAVFGSTTGSVWVYYWQCLGLLLAVFGSTTAVFGSTTGSVWVYYWQCLGLLLAVFGSTTGSVWVYYWQCLGLLLAVFGSTTGSVWVYYWQCLGLLLAVFGSTTGSVWVYQSKSSL